MALTLSERVMIRCCSDRSDIVSGRFRARPYDPIYLGELDRIRVERVYEKSRYQQQTIYKKARPK